MWRAFEIIYLITSGGPMNKTSVLSYLVYTTAFKSGKMNYAAGSAVLMSLASLAVTLLLLRVPEPETAD